MNSENVSNEAENPALNKGAVSGSTGYNKKPIWTDYHLNGFKFYRKWRKTNWYKHQFTNDALQLSMTFTGTWWALYGNINRYSNVVETEEW